MGHLVCGCVWVDAFGGRLLTEMLIWTVRGGGFMGQVGFIFQSLLASALFVWVILLMGILSAEMLEIRFLKMHLHKFGPVVLIGEAPAV